MQNGKSFQETLDELNNNKLLLKSSILIQKYKKKYIFSRATVAKKH